MPDDGLSQKPKRVASNKTDINVVVTDGLYFLFEGGDDDDGDNGRKGTVVVTTSCFLFLLMFSLMMNGQAIMRIDSRGSTPSWIGSSLPFPVEKNDKGRRWNTDLYGGKADEDRGKAKENTSTTFQSKSFPHPKTKRNDFFLFYM